MSLIEEAHATLEAIARGEYVAPSGRVVALRDAVDAAVRATELLRGEALAALAAPSGRGAPAIEVTGETTSAAARRLVEREGGSGWRR